MEEPPQWEGTAIGPFVTMRADRILFMDFGTSPTDAELDAHCTAMLEWHASNDRPIGALVFLRSLLTGTAKQRRRMAELEKQLEEHDAKYVCACGIVAQNAMTRGLVTAVFWLKPPVYPYKMFATFDEALAWVEAAMRSAAA